MANKKMNLYPQQQKAMVAMMAFTRSDEDRVFILSGYAGTGKTTLLRAYTEWLVSENYVNGIENKVLAHSDEVKTFMPMASTGRAAKILRDKIGQTATTVHSAIYFYKGFNQDLEKMTQSIDRNVGVDKTGQLYLTFGFEPIEQLSRTVYIIDEASMISDTATMNPTQALFGSGKLLEDLLHYDPNGKFVFVGDDCQLPPIEGDLSPALSADYISQNYGLGVKTAVLTDIIRQQNDNDIIIAANKMRTLCENPPQVKWGQFPFRGYRHINVLSSQRQLIEQYVDEIRRNGYEAATLITGSNKSCVSLATIIRKALGYTQPRIMEGELLLVTQNNISTGLMNGDLVVVKSVGDRRTVKSNLTFLNVEVEELASKHTHNIMLIEDILYSSYVNLTQDQQKNLFIDFYRRERAKGIKEKDRMFRHDLMNDPYLNALRAVFGYAITCHKSQGGEWKKVFVDIPRRMSHRPDRSTYQWLYTAMTRASEMLYVANDFFIV